jgi:hypothetical protein
VHLAAVAPPTLQGASRVDAMLPLGQSSGPPAAFVGVLALIVLVGGAIAVAAYQRQQRKQADLARLLARDETLTLTSTPCGLSAAQLAGMFAATPRGDRRYGLRYGVTGPLEVTVAGATRTVECACFQWHWEERRTTSDSNGTRTRYETKRAVAAVLRLPVAVPTPIRIGPESIFGRLGLTRGGHQLESSEFNRRFRVEGPDRALTVQLLDAGLQQRLLEEYPGRSVEVTGDLLALGGTPAHRDATLTGVIGELPAVRQDVRRLVERVPEQFWRAIGAHRAPPSAPPTPSAPDAPPAPPSPPAPLSPPAPPWPPASPGERPTEPGA